MNRDSSLAFFPHELTNDDRADFAATALQAYFIDTRYNSLTYGDEGSLEMAESLGDLLCDLRHLASRAGLDWRVLNQYGEQAFLEEQADEVGNFG